MSLRLKIIVAFLAVVALAAAGYFVGRPRLRARVPALDALPADAFLVITVDVEALRKSPLGAPLFGGASSKLLGEKAVTGICGFDPLARLTEIAVAVPEESSPGDFGAVVRAAISRDELLGCAQKVLESRHAQALGAPTVRTSGSYTLIEADSPRDDSSHDNFDHRYPTLAYREGGPFLVGHGPWLSTMIDTVEGRLPNVRANDVHMSLRGSLGQRSVGQTSQAGDASSLAVLATAQLPKGLRDRLKAEMAGEAGDSHKEEMMSGILGVSSAGVGLVPGRSGEDTIVTLVAECEDASACSQVAQFVGKKRFEWSKDIALRLLGLGPLLDGAKIENSGTLLRVTSRAPSDTVSKWLERVLQARSVSHPMPAAPLPNAPLPGIPASSEPRRAGAGIQE